MPLLRNRQLAIKIESVEGVAESLAAADADLLAYEPSFVPDVSVFDRTPARGSLTPFPGVAGIRTGNITGKVEVRGSGTATTAPSWGKLLEICGFSETSISTIPLGSITGEFTNGETVTGGTSSATARVLGYWSGSDGQILVIVISGTFDVGGEALTGGDSAATAASSAGISPGGFAYEPISTVGSAATCAIYDDGVKEFIRGSRGNLTFEANAGEPGFFGFSIMGVAEDWVDASNLTGIAYETTVPPVLLSAVFRLGTYTAPLIASINFDMANQLAGRTDINDAAGVLAFRITGRGLTGGIDPELVTVATYDVWTKIKNQTSEPIAWKHIGGAGNNVQIVIPEAQIRSIGDENRDNIRTMGLGIAGVGNATADRDVLILAY